MTNVEIDKLLEGLTSEEKLATLQILKEYSNGGSSSTYNNLLYKDYKEVPVNMHTFLHDPLYLGRALVDEEGRYTLFPYWEKVLEDMFSSNTDDYKYQTAIFTGGIGLGKSTVAVIGIAYLMYLVMCMKNPYTHYGIQEIDKITFAFLNNTLDNARDVAWTKFHNMLKLSPWFIEHGHLNTLKKEVEWEPPSGIELITGSSLNHLLGRCVLGAFVDEINFGATSNDIEKQKKKALDLVTGTSIRMGSRFMKSARKPYILFIASSKADELSFLETFIEKKKKDDSNSTLIIDEPQWVIRTDKDNPVKFKVALGNKFLSNELLPLDVSEELVLVYRNRGYSFIDVPVGYLSDFRDDLDRSLRDIAGISTSGTSKYISGPRLAEIKTDEYQNFFLLETIEVGNDSKDTTLYYDYIDESRIDPILKGRPMYIHLDMSLSGDKTGIAGVWVTGKSPHKEGVPDSKDLVFKLAFHLSVKAPKGYQVSFEKNRNLIRWLKEKGFVVKGVSYDTYQSADLGQTLSAEGYDCKVISVDRLTDSICLPYQYFRSSIYEHRIEMYQNTHLTDELIGLERKADGHIDHSPSGIDEKDAADAVCGAIYNASLHAEQLDFDYGDELNIAVKVSLLSTNPDQIKKQITMDFEKELQKMYNNNVNLLVSTSKSIFTDFGWGSAKQLNSSAYYLSQGIII